MNSLRTSHNSLWLDRPYSSRGSNRQKCTKQNEFGEMAAKKTPLKPTMNRKRVSHPRESREMDLRISILGFVVGLLVGLTGMGGGAVMTPALILLGLARPAIAVGTDLVWGTLTKAVGAFVHCRQKTVDYTIVKRLAIGSIPGALAGFGSLGLLAKARSRDDGSSDSSFVGDRLDVCGPEFVFPRYAWSRLAI